jgi:dipeptidyl aminopeptidase/acylaminoacyl peptidase
MALLTIVVAQTVAAAAAVAGSDRIIEQSVAMWRIANSTSGTAKALAAISADGMRVAVVLSRGLVQRGVSEYELRVYDLNRSGPKPVVTKETAVLRRFTPGNAPAIRAARWLADGRTLAVLAIPNEASPDAHQVYVIDTRNSVATQRTSSRIPILSYGISDDGATIVYATRVPADTLIRERERLSGVVAGADEPGFQFDTNAPYGRDVELFVQPANGPFRSVHRTRSGKVTQPVEFFERSGFIEVSPDGSQAIIGMHFPDSIPIRWRGYKSELVRDFIDVREHSPPTYGLLDLATNRFSFLLDAPSVWGGTAAVWSPDGRFAFVTGFLPVDSTDSAAVRSARSAGGVLVVDVSSRTARPVLDGVWQFAHVSQNGDTVSLTRPGQRGSTTGAGRSGVSTRRLVREGREWRVTDSTSYTSELFHTWGAVTASDQIVVGIHETLDSAPELAVVDRRSGRGAVITSLNPALRTLPRGSINRVEWKSSRGDVWEAHLVTPVGYKPGSRYAAVIMIMDMSYRDGYVLDGRMYKSAYPVQALANRGMVVLMTYFPPVFFEHYVRPLEREIILAGTDGAFEYLVREGLADSARIGITGFSHAGYVTQYAITHSSHRYAAAIAMDNFNASYLSYIIFNFRSTMNAMEDYYGGSPFGAAITTWQKEAPGFAVARVRTPLLLEQHGSGRLGETPTSNISSWETFAGLSRLGKPVELIRYRYGQHILEKPMEQYSSARRQVDWLSFWLKDEVDGSDAKVEQYRRWKAMGARAASATTTAR